MKKNAIAADSPEFLHFEQDALRASGTHGIKNAIYAALHQIQKNPRGFRPYPFHRQDIWICQTLVVPQLVVAYRLEARPTTECGDQKCWRIFPLLVRLADEIEIDEPDAFVPFTSVAVRIESRDHSPTERLSSALARALDSIDRLRWH